MLCQPPSFQAPTTVSTRRCVPLIMATQSNACRRRNKRRHSSNYDQREKSNDPHVPSVETILEVKRAGSNRSVIRPRDQTAFPMTTLRLQPLSTRARQRQPGLIVASRRFKLRPTPLMGADYLQVDSRLFSSPDSSLPLKSRSSFHESGNSGPIV